MLLICHKQTIDAEDKGLEFGQKCESGLGKAESTTDLIVSASIDYVRSSSFKLHQVKQEATVSCLDVDGMVGDDTAGTTSRQDLTEAVLQGSPSLSDPDGDSANLGQRAHGLNASGYGTWPYIIAIDLMTTTKLHMVVTQSTSCMEILTMRQASV